MSFSGPVQQMVGTAAAVQQASADLARLDDVLHYRRDWRFPQRPAPRVRRASPAGHLSLHDVSFGYNPLEPPLIENFSLDVAPGQWVALVGASGSGKSTLGKLITGLYEPRTRRDPHRRPHAWPNGAASGWRTSSPSVDQDIRLFRGTVRDNVTLWDDTVDRIDAWWPRSTMPASRRSSRQHDRQSLTARSTKAAATSTAASASA